jgi:hypothetical protein
MFDWIKNLFNFKIKPTFNPTSPITPATQEDPRTIQSIKNTRKAFEQQKTQMQRRALKSHAAECNDPWTCIADPCFRYEPDKIISVQDASEDEIVRMYAQRRLNQERLKGMKKSRIKKQSS